MTEANSGGPSGPATADQAAAPPPPDSGSTGRLFNSPVAKGVLRRVGDRKGTIYEAVSDK